MKGSCERRGQLEYSKQQLSHRKCKAKGADSVAFLGQSSEAAHSNLEDFVLLNSVTTYLHTQNNSKIAIRTMTKVTQRPQSYQPELQLYTLPKLS